jgi:hypothetical protein
VRALAAGLGLVVTVLLPISSPEAAHADPIGHCSTTVGTIVAVDFAHWGGPIVRGCGVNDATGYQLLHAGGFSSAGDSHDGPGFICRLGNQAFDGGTQYPTPKQDPCVQTPSPSADWSYWLAPAGRNTWRLSPLGAMSERPKPGEVELWMYGGTNAAGTSGSGVPTFSPNTVRATNTQPAAKTSPSAPATHRPSPKASHAATAGTAPRHSPGSHATAGTDTSPSASASPHKARAGHSHTPSPSRSSPAASVGPAAGAQAASDPKVVNAQPGSASHDSGGSAVPLLVGLALVIVLGGAAGWTVWRRRQQEL